LDPVAPVVADPDEVEARWEFHPLSAAVPVIRDCVGEALGEAQGLIVVTDAEGTILWIDGDARVRIDTADMVNLAVGASLRESGAGTNAVGTALAAQHAVQVFCE
jgi:transcriptional regulator of acetoin/glycerol metabolism